MKKVKHDKNIKLNSGITLIALIITIILLLILAGVVINLVLGENGIIALAQRAGIDHKKAAMREQLVLEIANLQGEKLGTATLKDITRCLAK